MERLIISKSQMVKFASFLILFLYIGFLYLDVLTKDLGNSTTLNIKYLIIIICLIISLTIGEDGHNKTDLTLVQIARFFTLIADYYLVILDNYTLGVFFFCLVQITYIIRHSLMENKKYRNLIFLSVTLIIVIFLFKKVRLTSFEEKLLFLAFIYAALLISSIYVAIRTIKSSKKEMKKGEENFVLALSTLLENGFKGYKNISLNALLNIFLENKNHEEFMKILEKVSSEI